MTFIQGLFKTGNKISELFKLIIEKIVKTLKFISLSK